MLLLAVGRNKVSARARGEHVLYEQYNKNIILTGGTILVSSRLALSHSVSGKGRCLS